MNAPNNDILGIHSMSQKRSEEFLMGRYCARTAISALGGSHAQLNRKSDGAVEWPSAWTGSISHSQGVAIAQVGRRELIRAIGIDIEPVAPLPIEIARAFACDQFIGATSKKLAAGTRVGFSAREAAYKALSALGHQVSILSMQAIVWADAPDFGRFAIDSPEAKVYGLQGQWWVLDEAFLVTSVVIPMASDNQFHLT
ncbi:4'-phosphopantetheinyl transferase family protein [Glutamicibacter endophyticus]|uniref:4'-phosphopantetheinyl transferase family protein n=1 Tax=Glutamicibacter endophyticus TaxID=1522174 RepID=UPI003AF056E8